MDEGDRLKNQLLTARLLEHQYKLSEYTDKSLKSLQRSLNEARSQLFEEVGNRDFRLPSGREHAVLNRLNDMTLGIQNQLTSSIKKAAASAGEFSVREYGQILSFDETLVDTVGFDLALPSPDQLTTMTDAKVGGKLLEEWVANSFESNIVDGVQTSITAGMLRGVGTDMVVQGLTGAFDMIKKDAESLARTHIASVNNAAAERVYKANSDIITSEEWSAALEVGLSGRSTCLRCAVMDGRKFKLNEDHVRPPLHIRCRCFMVPVTLSYKELGLDIGEMKKSKRAFSERSKNREILKAGQFDGDFKKFLNSRSVKYQKDLLGPNRYRMLKDGDIKWEDLVDKNGNVRLLKRGDGEYSGLMKAGKNTKYVEPNAKVAKGTSQAAINDSSQQKAESFYNASLTSAQKTVINEVTKESRATNAMRKELAENVSRYREMSISADDIKALENNITKNMTVAMNRSMRDAHSKSFTDVLENGKFKNQFELSADATSGGGLFPQKGRGRDLWEKEFTQGAFHSNKSYLETSDNGYLSLQAAQERPVYGYLVDNKNSRGKYLSGSYGEVTFILKKEILPRITMTDGNSSGFTRKWGSMLMNKDTTFPLTKNILQHSPANKDVKEMISGTKKAEGFTVSSYVETQVYGGIDLKRDVEKIAIPDRDYEHIRELGKKFNIPVEYK